MIACSKTCEKPKTCLRLPIRWNVKVFLLSMIIAFASTIGTRFNDDQSLVPTFKSSSSLVLFLLETLLWFCFSYAMGSFLFTVWEKAGSPPHTHEDQLETNQTERHGISNRFASLPDRQFLLACIAVMLSAWMIWIVGHLPGTMRDDSIPQYLQAMGYVGYYTQHPIFDTLCFGIFWHIGESLGSPLIGLTMFIITQAFITSVVFSIMLLYLRRRRVPAFCLVTFLLYFAFARVIYQPIDTMSKDAWNAIFFTVVALQLFEGIRTAGSAFLNWKFTLCFIGAMFCCIASKRTMMYVVIPVVFALTLYLMAEGLRKRAAIATLAAIIPSALFLFCWQPLSVQALNASQNQTYEMYSIPTQQVIATLKSDSDALSDSQLDELGTYIDYEKAIDDFNPNRSDEANRYVVDGTKTSILLKTWLILAPAHLDTYISTFLGMMGNWMSYSEAISYAHDLDNDLLNPVRMEAWASFFNNDPIRTEEVLGRFRSEPIGLLAPLNTVLELLDRAQRIILAPFTSFGLYSLAIPAFVTLWALTYRNTHTMLAMTLPAMLFLSYIVGPIALFWYVIPSNYIAPLLLSAPFIFSDQDTQAKTLER